MVSALASGKRLKKSAADARERATRQPSQSGGYDDRPTSIGLKISPGHSQAHRSRYRMRLQLA